MKYTKRELKKIHVRQLGEHTCGLACLSAIANYYNGEVSQENLRSISGTTLNGTTLLGLCQAAREIGFDASGCKANIENLKKLDRPVILHVVPDKNRQHFVVSYGYVNGTFMIGDPGWGIVEYSDEELKAIWQSETLLRISPGNSFKTVKKKNRAQYQWFKTLIREDIPILSVAAVVGVFIAMLGLSTAIFTQKLIDEFLPYYDMNKIIMGTAILALLLLLKSFLAYVRGIWMAGQGRDLNVRIVDSFLDKIIYLPISYFRGFSTGDLVARMNDSMRIRNSVALVAGDMLIHVLVITVSTAYIFILSAGLGLLSISGTILFLLIASYFHPKILEYQRDVMTAHAGNETQYIDSISGMASIKSFNRESVFKDRILAVYKQYQSSGYKLEILGNEFGFVIQIVVSVYTTLFFGMGTWYLMNNNLLLGELMAVLTLSGSVIPSLAGLVIANLQIQEAKIAFDRLYEISSLDKEFEPGEENSWKKNTKPISALSIQNIKFRFPGTKPLLESLSLSLTTGMTATLFGDVGSGKSTLVDIIQGFYQPEKGTVLINGRDIYDYGAEQWRSFLGIVSQSGKIFNTTVLDNICLDNNPDDVERCIKFLHDCGFISCIETLPQGLFTICGEEGNHLSGGQKQLVAIARALCNKPLFLILDEATSAMDSDTEQQVLQLLNQYVRKQRIGILMVTHRISLAGRTDKIFMLQDGTICDSGTHRELIRKNPGYARSCKSELVL